MKYTYLLMLVGLIYGMQSFASDIDQNKKPASCILSNGTYYGLLSGLGVGVVISLGVGFGVPILDYRAGYLIAGSIIGGGGAGSLTGWLIERSIQSEVRNCITRCTRYLYK